MIPELIGRNISGTPLIQQLVVSTTLRMANIINKIRNLMGSLVPKIVEPHLGKTDDDDDDDDGDDDDDDDVM